MNQSRELLIKKTAHLRLIIHRRAGLFGAGQGFALAPLQDDVTPVQAIVPILLTGFYALYGGWLVRRRAKGEGVVGVVAG